MAVRLMTNNEMSALKACTQSLSPCIKLYLVRTDATYEMIGCFAKLTEEGLDC